MGGFSLTESQMSEISALSRPSGRHCTLDMFALSKNYPFAEELLGRNNNNNINGRSHDDNDDGPAAI